MELQLEDQLILSCIKIHVTSEKLEEIDGLILQIQDWERVINTIIDLGIGPLFYMKLTHLSNSSLIPEFFRNKLQQVYYKTFSRSTILYDYFTTITRIFAKQNIPIIALKGIYLSEWLYQDIGLRQFSDIDLLVKEEDGLKGLALLAELGYKPSDTMESEFVKAQSEIVHYPPMVLNGVSVEIHIKLHKSSEKYSLAVENLWENSRSVVINGCSVYTLGANDLLIHLCTHLDKHFRDGHVLFTCFSDITNLLDKYKETIDWYTLVEVCSDYNCEDVVFEYIVLVNRYMHAYVPQEIIDKYKSLLLQKDEETFLAYLRGDFAEFSAVPQHMGNLKKLNTLTDKLRYVWDILFPSKAFMVQKYGLDPQPLKGGNSSLAGIRAKLPWWLWYPYRWWVGVKGVFKVISGK